MGRVYVKKLDGAFYTCGYCRTHLATIEELMSKAFHSKNGKAYLFNSVVNITVGESEERLMTTGMHVVADIYCIFCRQNVGWKYEAAYEDTQKYKEGKFILERSKINGIHKDINNLLSSDADDA